MTSSALTIPKILQGAGIIALPDTGTHRFRFDIPSESSDKIWRISQRISSGCNHGQYECSCPSWIYKRGGDGTGLCKHLKYFKPALDELARQADKISSPTTAPALPAPKPSYSPTKKTTAAKTTKTTKTTSAPVSPSKGLLDGFDDLEAVSPVKPTATIKKGQITLNQAAQNKVGSMVQLLYSASKGVIVLKPVDDNDNSFDVDNGVIDASDFISNIGKIKSGDIQLDTIKLAGDVTAYAISVK